MLVLCFGRAGSGESPFPRTAPICPALASALHSSTNTRCRQPPWCAILTDPGLFFRGKGRCEKVIRNFSIFFFVQITLNRLCFFLLCLCTLKTLKKCLPDCQKWQNLQRHWKRGKHGGNNGEGRIMRLWINLFNFLMISSAFPSRLKFALETEVVSAASYRSVTQYQLLDKNIPHQTLFQINCKYF